MSHPRIDYNKLEMENKRHPLCRGTMTQTLDGNEYDCEYGSDVTCDKCRFMIYNRGRGKDPRAKINNQ
jgi:hypothetical protein